MLFTNKIKKIQFKESIKVVVAYMETYNTNVWFPQISILSSWKVNGNSKGRGGGGVSTAKLFKEKYEAELEIPGGGRFKRKHLPWGRYDYSWTTQCNTVKQVPFSSLTELIP